MYTPPAFAEDRPEVLARLMAQYPLATLVTHGAQGLSVSLIPMQHDPVSDVVRAHLARANGQIADLREMEAKGREVLVLFQGAQGYVSPGWYATKAETGKVVPTWNYLAVELRGVPKVIDDPAWLRDQVGALTDLHEADMPTPWAVSDAPDNFVAAQLRGIVGLEIQATQMAGKWKASQNRTQADRAGVISGLRVQENPMADAVPAD